MQPPPSFHFSPKPSFCLLTREETTQAARQEEREENEDDRGVVATESLSSGQSHMVRRTKMPNDECLKKHE